MTLSPDLFSPVSLYQYQSLPQDDYIRILYIASGELKDPISFHLLSVPLVDAPSYECLSYVWGNEVNLKPVSCGRGQIMVRGNLIDALRYLRHPTETRSLWIDALCINQEDVNERNKQVQMMGLIYWHANRVIVWLGLDDDPHIPASEVMDIIRETSKVAWASMQAHDNNILTVPEVTLADLTLYNPRTWTLLSAFFSSRPWFHRAWTIQEIGLARDAYLICGRTEIKLDDYLPFIRWIVRKGQLVCDKFGIDLSSQYLATEYWLSTRTPEDIVHMSFLQVLEATRSVNCTNPRDCVYAFLGHPSAFEAHPGDERPYVDYEQNYFAVDRKPIIKSDYTKSVAEVYTESARALMLHYGDLSVLSCVHRTTKLLQADESTYPSQSTNPEDALQGANLPSWVPRWDLPNLATPFGINSFYTATLASTSIFNFPPSNPNHLTLRGQQIDNILWTYPINQGFSSAFYHSSPNFPIADVKEDRLEALWNTLRYRIWALKLTVKPSRQDFLYTLTVGTIDGLPAEDEQNAPRFAKNVAAYELATSKAFEINLTPEKKERLESESIEGDAGTFLEDVQQMAEERALFLTANGRVGLGPRTLEKADVVWLLEGANVPFVLRYKKKKREREAGWRVVGEAYLQGVMRGEAFEEGGLGELVLC
jgi:hypothetical protein